MRMGGKPANHPGERLRDELDRLGLSPNALAVALGVHPGRIRAILNGTRAITADTALRLARYFGTTAQFWLNLQNSHDLQIAESALGDRLAGIAPIRPHPELPKAAMGRVPQSVLDLPLHERALIALREAVKNAIAEHRRLGQPVYVWRDGQVIELPPDEPIGEDPPETAGQPDPDGGE